MVIKVFSDGADIEEMHLIAKNPVVKGWTTNPTLMRKAGVKDFRAFAQRAITAFPNYPLSLEVFADDFGEMESQAREIASWGDNVLVKIPITNTKGESTAPLIKKLSADGIKLNVTAIFTQEQVWTASQAMKPNPGFISIFAGRIADTGRDPELAIRTARGTCPLTQKIIWASPREVFNVWQADAAGCDIITLSPDLLGKLSLAGKSLEEFSLSTVQMFFDDAQKAGYAIAHPASWGGGGFG